MSMFDTLAADAGLAKETKVTDTEAPLLAAEPEELVEVVTAEQMEATKVEDQLDFLTETLTGLENLHNHVSSRKEEGMSVAEAKVLMVGVNNLLKPLGMSLDAEGCGIEDFEDEGGSVLATTASCEAVGDKLKQIAEAVRRFIVKAIEKAKQMLRSLVLGFGRLEKNAKALGEKEVKGTAEDKLKGLNTKFFKGGKPASASDLSEVAKMITAVSKDSSVTAAVTKLAKAMTEAAKEDKVELAPVLEAQGELEKALVSVYGASKDASEEQAKKAGFGSDYDVKVSDEMVGGYMFAVGMAKGEGSVSAPKVKVIRFAPEVKKEAEFEAASAGEIKAIAKAVEEAAMASKALSESYDPKAENELLDAASELAKKDGGADAAKVITAIRGYSALVRSGIAGATSLGMGVGTAAYSYALASSKAYKEAK